ncbi:MAG: hypothetical protein V7K77_08195 [Nostoc sp.]|uniref:hypothetical protein n=1 Tax=Nostoc sp. TaxID=1180 RepID=UPI002FFA8773
MGKPPDTRGLANAKREDRSGLAIQAKPTLLYETQRERRTWFDSAHQSLSDSLCGFQIL